MQTGTSAPQTQTSSKKGIVWGVSLFVVVAIIGLYWAKWNPYYHKVFVAASQHNIGSSSISGDQAKAPAPSWQASLSFSLTYFKSIWKAFVVAIILSSLVQVALPKDWIQRVLGKTSFGSTLVAGLSSLPGMMCTCCTAPVVVGLRKQSSSLSAAVAFWLGNPALNPAVLVFMFFILGWKFTLLRLVFAIIMVFGLSYLTGRVIKDEANVQKVVEHVQPQEEKINGPFLLRWIKSIGWTALATVPAYIVSIFVLGAARAWLFPAVGPGWGNSFLFILLFAVVGTLFVIPTAGEIPIIQTFMSYGLGGGPAAVLAVTLPVISLPSALMVRQSLSWRAIGFLGLSVAILGVIAGVIGIIWL